LDLRRVELARENGATRAYLAGEADPVEEVLQLTGRHGADATIITATSGESGIVQQAMEITRKKGKVVVVGAVGLGLERSPFYEKEIDFLISCSYGPGRYDEVYEERGLDYPYSYVRWTENRNMSEYLRLVAEGGVRIGPVLEREYDIDQAVSAYEELKTGASKPLGVLLRYPGAEGLRADNAVLASRVRLRSVPAGGRIRVAVVGAGAFAKNVHLPNLKGMSDRYQIRAVVSATGSNAKSTAQQFGAEYAGTSYEEILADPEVEAVILCTHHHLHARQTVDALKAGKHVYCEKPLAMNEEELAQILGFYGLTVESAMEIPDGHLSLQPVLMVGYNRRFSPAIGKIREILRDRSNPLMSLYRVNAGYIPPGDWVQGPECGGRILGEMCHMFDLFGFLTGAPARAVSVEPMGSKMEQLSARDNLCATVRYEDGSVCTLLYYSLGAPGLGKEYLEVHTDGKSMVVDDFRSMRVFGSPIGGWKGITADKGHVKALEAFAEALKGGRGWPIPLRSLVDSARVTFTVDSAVK
ncbi:MAG: Gfo/Idh/MocA family oxidoreductase, partial [Deltaproteobacteria bacterium]|nr:Gfo/Idh/MocA family oxidoreductase [Deltaproteobacteria bacterium]